MRHMEKQERIHGIRLASIAFVRPQPPNAPFGAVPQTPPSHMEVTV